MSLKPLIALTVISLSIAPGVKGDPSKNIPAIPPKSREIMPFKKTGLAFLATNVEQEEELFGLGCVAVAPPGTPLDPESSMSEPAPAKKPVAAKKAAAAPTAASMTKPAEPAAKAPPKVVEAPAAPSGEDTGKGDDGTGMV
jgi:hypothetical protein